MPDVAVSIIKELSPDGHRGGCGSWMSDGDFLHTAGLGQDFCRGLLSCHQRATRLNLMQRRQVTNLNSKAF